MMEKPEIFRLAVDTWGREAQILMLLEEMAELAVALCHRWRGREANLVSEIADVELMLEQLVAMDHLRRDVSEAKLAKLARLERILIPAPTAKRLGEGE